MHENAIIVGVNLGQVDPKVLNEEIEELTFREIFGVITENGIEVTQAKLGRWLRSRIPVRKSGENRYYDISVLSEAEYDGQDDGLENS